MVVKQNHRRNGSQPHELGAKARSMLGWGGGGVSAGSSKVSVDNRHPASPGIYILARP